MGIPIRIDETIYNGAKESIYVLRFVRRIQKSRSVPRSLDPVDKPRDVENGYLPQLIEMLQKF